MFWEKQLMSIIESGQLDDDVLDDFAVAYADETGDDCLIGSGSFFVFMLTFPDIRLEAGSESESFSYYMNESLSSVDNASEAQSWSSSVGEYEHYSRYFRESLSAHGNDRASWGSFSSGRNGSYPSR